MHLERLHLLLPVPSRPWESIAMFFLCGLPTIKKNNDYLFVLVDHFSTKVILIPCKKSMTGAGVAELFFDIRLKHFGCIVQLYLNRNKWGMLDTRLKKSKTFPPQQMDKYI